MSAAADYPWGAPEDVLLEIVRSPGGVVDGRRHRATSRVWRRAGSTTRTFRGAARPPRAGRRLARRGRSLLPAVGADRRPRAAPAHPGPDAGAPASARSRSPGPRSGSTWRPISPMPDTWSSTGPTTCGSPRTPTSSWARSRNSSPALAPSPDPDRRLATVLFTDIVGSTERAAELGDTRWRALLDEHDTIVRQELARFGGREIDTAGDGFLATFDGPGRAIRCAARDP